MSYELQGDLKNKEKYSNSFLMEIHGQKSD